MKGAVRFMSRDVALAPGRMLALIAVMTGTLLAALAPPLSGATDVPAGDAVKGKAQFEKRCTGCHGLDRDLEGPRLRGVYGRKAGNVSNYKYSDALRNAKLTWDETTLDKWLTNPDGLIPDNDMEFHVANPDERAGIIAYLRQSSGR